MNELAALNEAYARFLEDAVKRFTSKPSRDQIARWAERLPHEGTAFEVRDAFMNGEDQGC